LTLSGLWPTNAYYLPRVLCRTRRTTRVSCRTPKAKIVTGAGHFAMIEAAPTVNDEIGKFAARLA
jgi:hypothetical protein